MAVHIFQIEKRPKYMKAARMDRCRPTSSVWWKEFVEHLVCIWSKKSENGENKMVKWRAEHVTNVKKTD